jgi:hypothetical protein
MNNEMKQIQYGRLKTITKWLDTQFSGPFGWRFGWDPIIGLIPVLGDFVTMGFSIYILLNAFYLGCSRATFLRMLLNIAIEFVLELIPFFGPICDFFWKANTQNLKLLELHLNSPEKAHRHSVWALFSVLLIALLFIIICMTVAILSLKQILVLIDAYFK